jgi:hypothetical protein
LRAPFSEKAGPALRAAKFCPIIRKNERKPFKDYRRGTY